MAEKTTKASATPAAAATGSPSAEAKSVPAKALAAGASAASDMDALMAGMGVSFVGVPDGGDETRSPQEDDDEANAEADNSEEEQEQQDDDPGSDADSNEDADADEADADNANSEEEPKLGRYEASVVKALESHPDFKSVAKRVAKAFELAVSRREALQAKESELATQAETVKELETRLQETAEKVTVAPAGPLAHLADEQALTEEVKKCVDFLAWVNSTDDPASHYKDTDTATAEDQLAAHHRYALHVLKNQDAQSKVLKERQAVRAEVKKQRPTLFDVKHDDHKLLSELYKADPRSRADFDQLIADALRGRQIREAAAKAPAKDATAKPALLVKKVSKDDLPRPKSTSTLPVRGGGLSDQDVVTTKLKTGGRISFDEMADAGLMSRRVA